MGSSLRAVEPCTGVSKSEFSAENGERGVSLVSACRVSAVAATVSSLASEGVKQQVVFTEITVGTAGTVFGSVSAFRDSAGRRSNSGEAHGE